MKCGIFLATLIVATANAVSIRSARSLISERLSTAPGDCWALDEYKNKVAVSCCRYAEAPFHRKSEQRCKKLNKAAAKYCPTGYDLERHTGDHEHGDVCRRHDRKDWFAPRWCEQVAKGEKKPWTVQGCHNEPCRVPPTPQCACSLPDFISIGENYCRTEYGSTGNDEGYFTAHNHTSLAECQKLCLDAGDDCVAIEHTLKTNKCELWNTRPHHAKYGPSHSGTECFIRDRTYPEPEPEPEPEPRCKITKCRGHKSVLMRPESESCYCKAPVTDCGRATTENRCKGAYDPFRALKSKCSWCDGECVAGKTCPPKPSPEFECIGENYCLTTDEDGNKSEESFFYDVEYGLSRDECEEAVEGYEGFDYDSLSRTCKLWNQLPTHAKAGKKSGASCCRRRAKCEESQATPGHQFELIGNNDCIAADGSNGPDGHGSNYYSVFVGICREECEDEALQTDASDHPTNAAYGYEFNTKTRVCEIWHATPPNRAKTRQGNKHGASCYLRTDYV